MRKIVDKSIFEKGYQANWSDEVYIIAQIKQFDGVCWYYLRDLAGKLLKGFYLVFFQIFNSF